LGFVNANGFDNAYANCRLPKAVGAFDQVGVVAAGPEPSHCLASSRIDFDRVGKRFAGNLQLDRGGHDLTSSIDVQIRPQTRRAIFGRCRRAR
jgi:hypothetical protein